MRPRISRALIRAFVVAVAIGWVAAVAGQTQKPLTNQDITRMVRNAVPDSVIMSAIQAGPTNFDTSVDALIALHKAGVSKKVMDAMMAAGANRPSQPAGSSGTSSAGPGAGGPAGGASGRGPSIVSPAGGRGPTILDSAGATSGNVAALTPLPGQPSVMLLPAEPEPGRAASQVGTYLAEERTQLAETKTKPTSMTSLASDSALTQAMQGGITTATTQAMTHTTSSAGGTTFSQAGSVFSNIMAHRKPSVTYVWALPGTSSANSMGTSMPRFSIEFVNVPGINPGDFEPAIVKLTPSQNAWRLVGATQGKEDARSNSSADWQIYSGFLEDRVAVTSRKMGPGQYEISPASSLLPGEYGIVLRPVAKNKKFSGGDIARFQGDGMIFDSVWSFQIPAGVTGGKGTTH